MKKLTVFALVVIGALVLTACGPKVKEADAQKIAVEEDDGFDPYYAELTDPGDLDINPDFDPFNAIKNLGVDQAGFISNIKDTDYYTFYDNDDYDLHVFWKGLSSTLTDSDTSFFQLFTDKGSTVPFRMIYVDVYEDKDEFCKEFDYLDSKLQEVYGTPVSAGYVNADGEDNPCTMEDLKEDLPGIDNSDGGYVYISYDSANPHVEINGQYDPEDQCYRTFVEFLQTE